jgi:hypothetical protein
LWFSNRFLTSLAPSFKKAISIKCYFGGMLNCGSFCSSLLANLIYEFPLNLFCSMLVFSENCLYNSYTVE